MHDSETPPPEGYRPTVGIIRDWVQKYVPKPIRSFAATLSTIRGGRIPWSYREKSRMAVEPRKPWRKGPHR